MIQSYSLVDVITRSPSRPHIKHRFLIFSTLSGERYVIDPYIPVNGKKTRSPIQLNEYLKTIYGMGYLPVGMRGYGGKWGVI